MKPESPFSKLPSVGELLQHPTVQSVVKRVNQTTIAQRATGFLEELQASWNEQGNLPSVGELAERLAHRLLGRSDHCSPTVNATGVICSARWQAPLADAAVHEMLRFASDYQQPGDEIMDRVAASLAKLSNGETGWVASSFAAAVSMCAQLEGATVVTSPLMGLCDPADFGYERVDTIGKCIGEGADLVVVDGSGLLGGPRCGIVVGKHQPVEQLRQSELAPALAADAMILAALESTLDLYRTPEKTTHQIPILQLLSTPLENLQQRCERIAPLLAACPIIASAEPTEATSDWLDLGDAQLSAPTWEIVVHAENGRTPQLASQFEKATPQVIARTADGAIHLDFRAIFPRWDQHLISAAQAGD